MWSLRDQERWKSRGWCTVLMGSRPIFFYMVLQLQLTILLFVHMSGVQVFICALVPIDHFNLAWWIPVHLHDMLALPRKHPLVYNKGHFTKPAMFFGNWHLISACEQNNAVVKVDGVVGGWSVVQRWLTQLTKGFEASVDALQTPKVHHHNSGQECRKHSQNISRHSKSAIDGYGNPFLKESSDLILEHEITNRSVTEKENGTLDAVVVLNGPAIVNMLKPGAAKIFQEYAQDVSSWGLMSFGWLQIKSTEGTNYREGGVRRRIEPKNAVPKNWHKL